MESLFQQPIGQIKNLELITSDTCMFNIMFKGQKLGQNKTCMKGFFLYFFPPKLYDVVLFFQAAH